MGSQSVTNFSVVKMNRIRDLVKDYTPRSSGAGAQAAEIGAAAVGTLRSTSLKVPISPAKQKSPAGKGAGPPGARKATTPPTSEFDNALKSRSVEVGLSLILTMVEQLKKDPESVFEESGAARGLPPVVGICVFLKKAHSGILTKAQIQTESAFAANEAISKTIIDVVSRAFPREKEVVEIDWEKLAKAFKIVPQGEIITAYLENVAAALIDLVLDATRGRIPPARVDKIKQSVREHFVPEFVARIKRERMKHK